MINVNVPTVIIHLFLFLGVVVLLNQLLFKPLFAVMDERKNRVQGNQARAAELSAANEELSRQYRSQMDQAKKEAAQEKDGVRRQGEAEEGRIIKSAREQSGNLIADLQEKIALEYRAAETVLRTDTEALGRQIAAKMLGRSL